jgi:hypothetical protein
MCSHTDAGKKEKAGIVMQIMSKLETMKIEELKTSGGEEAKLAEVDARKPTTALQVQVLAGFVHTPSINPSWRQSVSGERSIA